MYELRLTPDRETTTLKPGDRMVFRPAERLIGLYRGSDRLYWGDDRYRLATFLRNEIDFHQFVSIIASTHGLSVEFPTRASEYAWSVEFQAIPLS